MDDLNKLVKPTRQHDISLGAGTISRSFELESWSYVQHKDFQVHVLQKTEKSIKYRPIIPTTEAERLSFVRGYATTPFKLQIMYLQQVKYSVFYWLYVWNVVFRSLPTNYIHVFLSSYSPSDHLYGSKMLPLCIGVSWQVVLCGLLQLVSSVDILSMFMIYSFEWIISKDYSWRCTNVLHFKFAPFPFAYICYPLNKFRNITATYVYGENGNIRLEGNYYRLNSSDKAMKNYTLFTAAPLHHFMKMWVNTSVLEYKSYYWIINYAVLWFAAGAFYKQLFRRYIWRLCHYTQTFMNLFYLVALLFIMWVYLEVDMIDTSRIYKKETMQLASGWDVDFLAEALTGPPVLHLLYARCPQDVSPGRDSTLITMSNSIMYFFKSLVNYKLKSYVESVFKLPVSMAKHNPYPIFYLWPFFFKDITFGTFWVRVFYLSSFIVEFLIFVITYQILVEVMVCEWALTRRWVATVMLSSIGLMLSVVCSTMVKIKAYIITTAITSLTEVVIICWMYPLDRLLDDVHFMNGVAMQPWRKWGLRMLPWYHIYKTYTMFHTFYYLRVKEAKQPIKKDRGFMEDFSSASWVWAVAVAPLPLGALYAIIKFIFHEKQNWRVIMKPRPDWGPQDHVTRQLRKQFDTREFVDSQAPRFLSRHVLAMSQTPTYRLDICYDEANSSRRSTLADKYQD